MIKVLWCVVLTCITTLPVLAQIQLNPQIGVNYTNFSVSPRDLDLQLKTEGKAGVLVGMDMRLGGTLFLQPGLFITGSKTVFRLDDGGEVIVESSEVTRYGAKLKGLLGLKLIDGIVKLRAMGGPSYDFRLGVNNHDNPRFDKENFRNGIFNLDAGVGVDILFLTTELGYSWALTETFDAGLFSNKPKYRSVYFTVGVVLGN